MVKRSLSGGCEAVDEKDSGGGGETGSWREADGSGLPGESGSRLRAVHGSGSEMGGRVRTS